MYQFRNLVSFETSPLNSPLPLIMNPNSRESTSTSPHEDHLKLRISTNCYSFAVPATNLPMQKYPFFLLTLLQSICFPTFSIFSIEHYNTRRIYARSCRILDHCLENFCLLFAITCSCMLNVNFFLSMEIQHA